MKNVNCEYGRWVVETQLCELRDRSDTRIVRAYILLYNSIFNIYQYI